MCCGGLRSVVEANKLVVKCPESYVLLLAGEIARLLEYTSSDESVYFPGSSEYWVASGTSECAEVS